MPKDSIEIKKFDKGVITNFDANDIPLDAASHSWNVDPTSENGSLSGIEVDLDATGDTDMPLYYESAIVNKDGQNTLIGYRPKLYNNNDASSDVFSYIKDFDGGSNISPITLDNSPGNNPVHACAMEVNNSEVHIGIGNAPAKWAGYIEYRQFGQDHGITMENARLSRPSSFTDMHKVIPIGDYLYGIKFHGKYIYKFHKVTKVIEKSKKVYGGLQAICAFSGDSNHLWLYDAAEGDHGVVYKVNVDISTDPDFEMSVRIASGSNWRVGEISDMIQTDKLWFIREIDKLPKDKLNEDENAWIWNCSVPTQSTSSFLASKTPLFKNSAEQTTTDGLWYGLEEGLFYKHGTTYSSGDHDLPNVGGFFSAPIGVNGYTNVNLPSILDSRFLLKEYGDNLITNEDKNANFSDQSSGNDWSQYSTSLIPDPGLPYDGESLKIDMTDTSNTSGGYYGATLAAANLASTFNSEGDDDGTIGYRNTYYITADIKGTLTNKNVCVGIGNCAKSMRRKFIDDENLSSTYEYTQDDGNAWDAHSDSYMTTSYEKYEAFICNGREVDSHTAGPGNALRFFTQRSIGGEAGSFNIKNIRIYHCRSALSVGQVHGSDYSDGANGYRELDKNGMPTDDIHYDPDLDTYYEILWDNRKSSETGYIGNVEKYTGADSKCAIWTVNSDPDSINFGKLNLRGIHAISNGYMVDNGSNSSGMLGSTKPYTHASCIDPVNKLIFTAGNQFISAHGYAENYISPRGYITHGSGNAYVDFGSQVTGMECDPNSRKLIIVGYNSVPRIYSYSEDGVIHDTEGLWSAASGLGAGNYNGIAIDTNRQLVFVTSNLNFGEISSLSYSDSEENTQPSMGSITIGMGIHDDGYGIGLAQISGGKLALDTDKKLVFVNVPFGNTGDKFLNVFSYDGSGNLSFIDDLKSSPTLFSLPSVPPTNNINAANGKLYYIICNVYNSIGDNIGRNQPFKIKVDSDSNLVFVHTGMAIASVPYNDDGTFGVSDFDSLPNPERRIIQVPKLSGLDDQNKMESLQYYAANQPGDVQIRGLGFGMAIVKSPNTFNKNTGQGMLIIGSHKGITTTKGYSNNASYVSIGKTPLFKASIGGNVSEVGVMFPLVVNNGLGDGTGSNGPKSGNHIYFADGSSKIKSQMYWIYVDNTLDPSATNGDETLKSTKGAAYRALASENTKFREKIHGVAQSQETNNQKFAFTSSPRAVIGNDEVASEFSVSVRNYTTGNDWIEKSLNQNTAQAMTAQSPSVQLKNPSLAIFESIEAALTDDDDLTIDMFEGDIAGTGKWARMNFDYSGAIFTKDGLNLDPNKASGGIEVHDWDSIANIKTALNGTDGFTIVDSAGNSKEYIFQTTGGSTGSDLSDQTVIQIGSVTTVKEIHAQIAAAINSSNGHGTSGHNTIDVQDWASDVGVYAGYPDKVYLQHKISGAVGNIAITTGSLPIGTYINIVGLSGGSVQTGSSQIAEGLLTSPVDGEFNLITKAQDAKRGGSGVKQGNKYFYKVSFMYDGYQEGPLSDDFTYVPEEDGNLEIILKLTNASTMPKRVSHINLYRSESDNVDASKPDAYYRLCKSIRLDTLWVLIEQEASSSPNYGNFRQYTFLDEGRLFESFESRAGYSSVIQDMNLRYGLSTQLNNTHFVSNVHQPILDGEGENFIVKSFPYKFDTFDYTKDILRMPSKLTALQAFNGRIWAFSDSKMYKVEPNGLYIEDVSVGMGCVHSKSITVTPNGMFWCDKKNIYWHNGQQILPIGDSIKKNGQYSWQEYAKLDDLGDTGTCSNAAFSTKDSCEAAGDTWTPNNEVDVDTATAPQPPIAVYDANKQSVHFIFQYFNAANTSHAKHKARFSWVFNIPLNKWDLMEIRDNNIGASPSPLGKVLSAFTAPDGDAWYIINSNDSSHTTPAWKINKGSTKRAYTWESKDITLGADSQYKHFHSIDISGVTADLSSYLTIEVDGTSVVKTFEATEAGGRYVIKYGYRKGKAIKIKLNEVPGTNVIDSIGIIYRYRGAK